jgi:lysyl-tRNA synthetase class 2
MPRSSTPLAPSDLASVRANRRIRVAGRVLVARGRELDLADALGTVRVRCSAAPRLAEGDLATALGRWTGRAVVEAEITLDRRCPPPRGDGEFSRLAGSAVGRNLRARSRALEVVRRYFREQRFVEVDTPLRVPAPGVDLHMDAVRAEGGYLVTSPEHQMKRLLVGGLPRIFQVSRATRRAELGRLHEPEFVMLEWYRAFAGFEDVLHDTERIVARVVTALAGKPRTPGTGGRSVDVRPPFRRHAGIADAAELAASDEDRYFELLVDRVEPALARLPRPVFLCDYPASQAALARRSPADPAVAERFELYVAGVELCNGYGELTDPVEQRRRMLADSRRRRRERRPVYPIDEKFLAALSEGLPPSAGNALGLDRLILLALGAPSLAEVTAFPSQRI